MSIEKNDPSVGRMIIAILIFLNAVIVKTAFVNNSDWWWALAISFPLLLISVFNKCRNKSTT